jgi:hypothetical protein
MNRKLSILIALTLVVGLGSTGCKKLIKKAAEKAKSSSSNKPSGGGSAGQLFTDASSIPIKFAAAIGNPVRVLEMAVYPGYVIAQIQDPKTPLNVDGYEMRGDVQRTGPVKFTGKQPTEKDLLNATFDIKEIDFTKLATMIKEAPVKTEVPDGKVSHVMIKKQLPFSNKTSIRIFVNGERKDGNLEYNPDGTVKKIYK